ncbi:hypothetical protein BD289DRAFT_86781 [Coniella lustricola]|uniref:Uncharacterized protein n=1 Tax=Coniella lustricola TaxID=2025994 RepID=A0A2T2ZYT3_9PEZI|nr:hypothetical protein BD289DRAFT_86781 [Coniella lustricola]
MQVHPHRGAVSAGEGGRGTPDEGQPLRGGLASREGGRRAHQALHCGAVVLWSYVKDSPACVMLAKRSISDRSPRPRQDSGAHSQAQQKLRATQPEGERERETWDYLTCEQQPPQVEMRYSPWPGSPIKNPGRLILVGEKKREKCRSHLSVVPALAGSLPGPQASAAGGNWQPWLAQITPSAGSKRLPKSNLGGGCCCCWAAAGCWGLGAGGLRWTRRLSRHASMSALQCSS